MQVGIDLVPPNSFLALFAAKDPTRILVELDKGIRSPVISEQAEAVTMYGLLITEFPLPVIVNTAFLKLSEAFSNGSGVLRFAILKAFEQCEAQVGLLMNADEVLKRIFAVWHSNDVIARALTLRVLGRLSRVTAHRSNVQDAIHRALQSRNASEVAAAFFALERLSAVRPAFGCEMLDKLTALLPDPEVPVSFKLQVIHVLRRMHVNVETAMKARAACLSAMSEMPLLRVVLACLKTTTELELHSLLNIPAQTQLLLSTFKSDARMEVKIVVAQCIAKLCRVAPLTLCDYLSSIAELLSEDSKSCVHLLGGLTHLPADRVLEHFSVVKELLTSTNCAVAAAACRVLTPILISSNDTRPDMESVVPLLCILASRFPAESTFFKALVFMAIEGSQELSAYATSGLVQLLQQNTSSLRLWQSLSRISLARPLVMMALKNSIPDFSTLTIGEELLPAACAFASALDISIGERSRSMWGLYQCAVKAQQCSMHSLASVFLRDSSSTADSEPFIFWLRAVTCISEGEQSLVTGDIMDGIAKLQQAASAIKAATTSARSFRFQQAYLSLRVDFLQCMQQLYAFCGSPAPKHAYQWSLDSLSEIERRLCRFLSSYFDVDHATHSFISLWHAITKSLTLVLSLFINDHLEAGALSDTTPASSYHTQCGMSGVRLQQYLSALQSLLMSRKVTQDSLTEVSQLFQSTSFPVPPYFYHTNASPAVEISITSLGDAVSQNVPFVLRINGVLQNMSSCKRRVKRVHLTVDLSIAASGSSTYETIGSSTTLSVKPAGGGFTTSSVFSLLQPVSRGDAMTGVETTAPHSLTSSLPVVSSSQIAIAAPVQTFQATPLSFNAAVAQASTSAAASSTLRIVITPTIVDESDMQWNVPSVFSVSIKIAKEK